MSHKDDEKKDKMILSNRKTEDAWRDQSRRFRTVTDK